MGLGRVDDPAQHLPLHEVIGITEIQPVPVGLGQPMVPRRGQPRMGNPVILNLLEARDVLLQHRRLLRAPIVHHDDLILPRPQILVQQRIQHPPDPGVSVEVRYDDAEAHGSCKDRKNCGKLLCRGKTTPIRPATSPNGQCGGKSPHSRPANGANKERRGKTRRFCPAIAVMPDLIGHPC